ncbi:MAG: hypothetical protein JWP44_4847 [Mucilaginibacter sp.]|nr:hypothetical protein [Mucilaginibacter sp.]
MDLSSILQSLGGGIQTAANGLGNGLFPTDPATQGYVDPSTAAAARNKSLISLGLGIMSAPYSRSGLGAGLLGAYQGSQNDYQGAMDTAFKNTLVRHSADWQNKQQDREIKLQAQSDRQTAATTATRVATGLQGATDPGAYWNLVQNSPDVKGALEQLGIQAPYTGPMADPNQMKNFQQQLSTAGNIENGPPAPIKLGAGEELVAPGTFQTLASAAPKSTVEWKDAGDKLIPKNSVTGADVPGLAPIPKSQTPTQEGKNFSPDESALMGAFSEAGVSLPAGMRSQQQMKATFRGLIDRNPGKTPDEVANLVRTGQLDFNGAKKSTAQLMTQAASANVQASKLEKDFALIEPLVAKLPNAPNVINRALVGLKNNLSFGGDKDSAQLVLYMREAATEYAKLSSGSTGASAPAEGNIKDAVEIFHKAFTEGGYQGLKEAMMKSAQNKRDAVQEGLRTASARGAGVGAGPPTAAASGAPAGADGKPLW